MDQAQIDNARVQLSYTRLTSPIDGVTGIYQLDVGNIIYRNSTSNAPNSTNNAASSTITLSSRSPRPSRLQSSSRCPRRICRRSSSG